MAVMLIKKYKPEKTILSMSEVDREKIAQFWLLEVQKRSNNFK
jgi:hypothetical protein